MINDMARVMQSKEYDQRYARAMRLERSKQYGQRHVKDKPGGGYIVNNTYAKTRNLSEKPDV